MKPTALNMANATQVDVQNQLDEILAERILILDGSMGALLYSKGLEEEDYRGNRFAKHPIFLLSMRRIQPL